jgi:hypothetical protein
MRRLFIVSILLFAGCQSITGPFEHRKPERVDDPLLSITEQQRRGRDRLALPEEAATVTPRTGVQPPSTTYGVPR